MSGPWEKYQSEDGPWSKYNTDYKQVVGSAIKNAFMQPGTVTRKLAIDPVAQAKALPPLASFAGAISPIPGGATMFGEGGRLLSDAALASYGQSDQIPSGMAHLGELGLNVLGDVGAIPVIKKYVLGRQIGAIEKARGVPPAQDIPSIPMATGSKTTGEFINDAITSVKSSQGRGTPSYWLQIKDQVDRLYRMGKDQALTGLDKGRLKWLSTEVQKGLNASVPGREVASKALARSQTIPRAFGQLYKGTPPSIREGIGWGLGAAGAGGLADQILKTLTGRE